MESKDPKTSGQVAGAKPPEKAGAPIQVQVDASGEPGRAQPAKKKKKKKYTASLRDIQRIESAVSKAGWRIADAVAVGLKRYRREQDRSARKRRDGALRDLPENILKAAGKTVRSASFVANDLAKAVRRTRLPRVLSRTIRL